MVIIKIRAAKWGLRDGITILTVLFSKAIFNRSQKRFMRF